MDARNWIVRYYELSIDSTLTAYLPMEFRPDSLPIARMILNGFGYLAQ